MTKLATSLTLAGFALGAGTLTASASSHREAPAIAEDQYADNTDVYAFISPNNPANLVIVANYVPLLLPARTPSSASTPRRAGRASGSCAASATGTTTAASSRCRGSAGR